MIIEIADISVRSGCGIEFEKAVLSALETVFPKANGFVGHRFHRGIESPDRYVLQLTWETLENHTVDFRGSALFSEWRSMVGAYFANPPRVEHFQIVCGSEIEKE